MTDFRARGTIMGPTGLTAVFGMGTGVTPPVWSPENRPDGRQAARSGTLRSGLVTPGRIAPGRGQGNLFGKGMRGGVARLRSEPLRDVAPDEIGRSFTAFVRCGKR
jgi:hypothetical protein